MDNRSLLVKVLSLLYRCRIIKNDENDSLIRTILETIKTDAPELAFNGSNSIKLFKDYVLSLLEDKEVPEKEVIFQSLSLILETDPRLLAVVRESIEPAIDDNSNKRIVSSLVKALTNYYKENLAVTKLNKAAYDLKFNRNKISNFPEYLQTLMAELEPLACASTSVKDPAVVGEVNFESLDSLTYVFEEVKKLNNNTGVYRLGLQELNDMTQGGWRRGESIGIEALQHKYKTGLTLSAFMHIALHNTPIATTEEIEQKKKPLLVRVSFEDDLTNNLQFMYQYLKAVEGITVTKEIFETMPAKEMSAYIHERLTATGFHIRMKRVDPSQWTYMSMLNYIIELEAQGYAVHMLMCDYLLKMPTTGCIQGATGADKRDMVRRVRNFCSARKIMFVSPYQLSTEAKQLIRNGVPEQNFVKEVAEKGYTDGCKTIDQELDLEIYLHLFKHKKKTYIALGRGKHRLPTTIDDDLKFVMYQFANKDTPILENINRERTGMRTLPRGEGEAVGDILSEILS